MSEFDMNITGCTFSPMSNDYYAGYKDGEKSQQAKIDEFQKLRSLDEMEINQLAQANQVWQIKCDEMQGRIDEAVDYIAESGGVNLTSEIALNDILKGNKDEN